MILKLRQLFGGIGDYFNNQPTSQEDQASMSNLIKQNSSLVSGLNLIKNFGNNNNTGTQKKKITYDDTNFRDAKENPRNNANIQNNNDQIEKLK